MLIKKTISSLIVAIGVIFISISLFSSIILTIKGREAQERVSSAFISEIEKQSTLQSGRFTSFLSKLINGKSRDHALQIIISHITSPDRKKEYSREMICGPHGEILFQQADASFPSGIYDLHVEAIDLKKRELMSNGGGSTFFSGQAGEMNSLMIISVSPVTETGFWYVSYYDMIPFKKTLIDVFKPMIKFRTFSFVLLSISSIGFFIFLILFSYFTIRRTDRMEKELLEANRELKLLSSLDGLTGIANRRCFDEYLAAEFAGMQKDGRPLSLLMADVDHFKKYNDTYGHQMGDLCLRRVAGVFAETCRRPTDLPARYGGEEFAVVLPDTDSAGAFRVADDIRTEINRLGIPHMASSTRPCVTISIGIATVFSGNTGTATSIINLADQALYKAKENGRDRVYPLALLEKD